MVKHSGIKHSRVQMDIPQLPKSPTDEDLANFYKLHRRSKELQKQRTKNSRKRSLTSQSFEAEMKFGFKERSELRRGGYCTASMFSSAECANILSNLNAQPGQVVWEDGGTFGTGSLRFTNASAYMESKVVQRVERNLEAIGLRIERSPRFWFNWHAWSLAHNTKNETSMQETHSDDQGIGLTLEDTVLLGSRIAIFIALEEGCSFGVSPDGLERVVLDVPVGKCVMFSPTTTAHFGTQRKAMRLFAFCEIKDEVAL